MPSPADRLSDVCIGQASESYRLSERIIGHLLEGEPTAKLVNRAIGGNAIAHIDENYATALGGPQNSRQ